MKCPRCRTEINVSTVMAEAGRRGGLAKGKSKRRNVDYVALAKLSNKKRKENAK